MASHVLALLLLAGMAALWVAVQRAWRRSFPRSCADPDVLAGRPGCGGCSSSENCERRVPAEEDYR